MHLLLLIAFIVCIVHYGLVRGTGHFIFLILKVIAGLGILVFGFLLLMFLIAHRF